MSDGRQRTYEELADRQERKGEARQRDVFLTLAADAAFTPAMSLKPNGYEPVSCS